MAQTNRRTLFTAIAALGIWVLAALVWPRFDQSEYHQAIVGTVAPDFELLDLQGNRVRLNDYRGRPIVLGFWAMGCPPCIAEAPHLSRLAREHAGRGLVVLAVNAWDESESSIARFVKKNDLQQIVLLQGSAVESLYAVPALPTALWIDGSGKVIDVEVGFDSADELDRRTEHLLSVSQGP